jgi:hypothetical protein
MIRVILKIMFQLFLRARARNFARGRETFKVRSPERDEDADRKRIETVVNAIETVLHAAEEEQKGLNQRVEDVLARAAVTVGNASDEYLDREPLDNYHQGLFSEEISNGQRRLKSLADTISHFKFLRAAVLSRFPDHKAPSPKAD